MEQLKQRLKEEGNETVTNCYQLKLKASDGKMRLTDVADTKQLFRIIQSIPSPKAEPFKQWMAQVASQRIDQMQDPELSIDQAIIDYKRLGYSDAWITSLRECCNCGNGVAQIRLPSFILSWFHYLILMRIENVEAHSFYEIEATQQQMPTSMLRSIHSIYPTRPRCKAN